MFDYSKLFRTELTEGMSCEFCTGTTEHPNYNELLEQIKAHLPEKFKYLVDDLDDEVGSMESDTEKRSFKYGFELGFQCKQGLVFEFFGVKLRITPDPNKTDLSNV